MEFCSVGRDGADPSSGACLGDYFQLQLTGSLTVKKFLPFMEPKALFPCLQESAYCPYPEPDQFSPCPHIPLLEDPS
jgi:hypothetical protein